MTLVVLCDVFFILQTCAGSVAQRATPPMPAKPNKRKLRPLKGLEAKETDTCSVASKKPRQGKQCGDCRCSLCGASSQALYSDLDTRGRGHNKLLSLGNGDCLLSVPVVWELQSKQKKGKISTSCLASQGKALGTLSTWST